MASVYAIFGTLMALGIVFPGLLTTWWLLFPRAIENAQARLSHTPGRCFAFGLVVTIALAVPVLILLALPFSPAKLLGAGLLMIGLGFSSLGAAGFVAEIAIRLRQRSSSSLTPLGAFLRAALALELAAAFPFIGWFLVIPATVLLSLGAASFAALGWLPRTVGAKYPAEPSTSQV